MSLCILGNPSPRSSTPARQTSRAPFWPTVCSACIVSYSDSHLTPHALLGRLRACRPCTCLCWPARWTWAWRWGGLRTPSCTT